jgi:hypothetical protein
MMRIWLSSLRDERVAFTGTAWQSRTELQHRVERKGGIPTAHGAVTGDTTVLVRGESSNWKYGDHGIKEREAARLIRKGASISLVHDSEFRKLLESGNRARVADRIAGDAVQWLAAPTKREFERAASKEGSLDREHTVLGRVEQSYLRHTLFGEQEQAVCSLCGRRLPAGLLIAAHVKPRSECSRRERLDVENIVFSMCLLGCDALYERGLVAVAEGGRILLSGPQLCPAVKVVLRGLRGRSCNAWCEARARYFKWHLTRRFQG